MLSFEIPDVTTEAVLFKNPIETFSVEDRVNVPFSCNVIHQLVLVARFLFEVLREDLASHVVQLEFSFCFLFKCFASQKEVCTIYNENLLAFFS